LRYLASTGTENVSVNARVQDMMEATTTHTHTKKQNTKKKQEERAKVQQKSNKHTHSLVRHTAFLQKGDASDELNARFYSTSKIHHENIVKKKTVVKQPTTNNQKNETVHVRR